MNIFDKLRKWFLNLKLQNKVLVTFLFFFIIISIILNTYLWYNQVGNAKHFFREKMDTITSIVLDNLMGPLSAGDTAGVDSAIQSLKNLPEIENVVVFNLETLEVTRLRPTPEKYDYWGNPNKVVAMTKGNRYLLYYPVTQNGSSVGSLMLNISLKSVSKLTLGTYIFVFVFFVILMAGVMVIVSIINSIIIKPIGKIAGIAAEVAKGNFNVQVDIQSKDQIGQLADVFNTMIRRIKENQDAVRERAQYLDNKITMILEWVSNMSKGDLTNELTAIEGEEVENLLKGLNYMLHSLKALITNIKESSLQISSSSTEIGSTNSQFKANMENQQKLVTETSASLTEIGASVSEVARNAKMVSQNAEKTKDLVEDGAKHNDEAVAKMQESRGVIKEILGRLFELQEAAVKINEIIEMIRKISEKSDLLALNAAIEASGAGESGKRFRIVADEMRRLADSSMTSSKEINQILTTIQDGIKRNVEMMNSASELSNEAGKSIINAGMVMGNSVKVFTETYQMMKEVEIATNQQVQAILLLGNAMKEIDVSSKQNVTGLEHSVVAVHDFISLANKLMEMVRNFKV